jgi:hypothetical protein
LIFFEIKDFLISLSSIVLTTWYREVMFGLAW